MLRQLLCLCIGESRFKIFFSSVCSHMTHAEARNHQKRPPKNLKIRKSPTTQAKSSETIAYDTRSSRSIPSKLTNITVFVYLSIIITWMTIIVTSAFTTHVARFHEKICCKKSTGSMILTLG